MIFFLLYYNVKKCYVNGISKFCNQVEYDNPKLFAYKVLNKKNGLVEEIWHKMANNEIITFDVIASFKNIKPKITPKIGICLLYTSPSPRDKRQSRMPSSA